MVNNLSISSQSIYSNRTVFVNSHKISNNVSFGNIGVKASSNVVPAVSVMPEHLLFINDIVNRAKKRFQEYTHNITRTYEHKIVYGLIEKELYGKNSIDSITHDLDKLFMYCLGFSHNFVSKFHRKHSTHHPESGKKNLNVTSMFVDLLASSPEFKPEKKYSLKTFYTNNTNYFSNISGFTELLKKYNFGENINLKIIKSKILDYVGLKGALKTLKKVFSIIINK